MELNDKQNQFKYHSINSNLFRQSSSHPTKSGSSKLKKNNEELPENQVYGKPKSRKQTYRDN